MKTKVLNVRVTEEQYEELSIRAGKESIGSYVRTILFNKKPVVGRPQKTIKEVAVDYSDSEYEFEAVF